MSAATPLRRSLAAVSRRVDRRTLVGAAVLLNTELLVVLLYLWLVGPRVTQPLLYVYPFVWLDVAAWAVWRTSPSPATGRRRLAAGGVALGYFAVLAYVGGLVGPGVGRQFGLRVALLSLPPGWSPALVYAGPSLTVALLPFKVAGYAALAYLVYATVLDAAGSAAGAALGLLSCVSCSLPIIAGIVSGLVGGGGALVAAAAAQSYGLSTVAFVATVALLAWRPGVADVARLRRAVGR